MSTRTTNKSDPQWVSVQLNVRMPFWYRDQLDAEADAQRTSTARLALDAIERVYKPVPPK